MFFRKNDYIKVDGSMLPLPDKRWCGVQFKNNEFYLKSAEAEAARIRDKLGCNAASHVLDVGCGQGRLPIGILRTIGKLSYTGIDIHEPSIKWCKKYIQKANPSFQFKHLNVYNERYSKHGPAIDKSFRFDISPQSVDIIYLYSVFTHMKQEEMEIYLKDFKRILRDGGKIFFSAFFEENVEDYAINPRDLHFEMDGPLHVVRYNKQYLFSILRNHGYNILDIKDENPRDHSGQQFIYLSHVL